MPLVLMVLQTLDISFMLEPSLASKIHKNFNLKDKFTKTNCSSLNFYLPAWEFFPPHYTSQDLAQSLSSDELWVSLLYNIDGTCQNSIWCDSWLPVSVDKLLKLIVFVDLCSLTCTNKFLTSLSLLLEDHDSCIKICQNEVFNKLKKMKYILNCVVQCLRFSMNG